MILATLGVILGLCCWSSADEWRSYSSAGWMSVRTITLAPDGSIWGFGGLNASAGGIFQTRFDGDTLAWRHYSPYNSLASSDLTRALYADLNGLWIGRYDGLTLFKGLYSVHFTTQNSSLPGNGVSEVCGDGAGGVWVAASRGLCRINSGIWAVFTSLNSPLPEQYAAGAMEFDVDSNVLGLVIREYFEGLPPLYGHPQLLLFDGQEWARFDEFNSDIPDCSPTDLLLDRAGVIWMAYQQNGVSSFDGAAWVHYTAQNSGLPSNWISQLAMDHDGDIYAVSSLQGGGLCKLKDGRWVVLPIITRWPYTRFYGMIFDREGDAWVFSSEGYIRISNEMVTLHCPEGLSLLDSSFCVKVIGSRLSDAVYVAGYDGGVSRLENGCWQTWTINNSGLPSKELIDIVEGPDGSLWVLTYLPIGEAMLDDAIYSLDRFDGLQWSNVSNGVGYFTGCYARAVAVDDDGNVWVAVEGKVLRFDGSFWTAFPIITDETHLTLYSLAIDRATGDLWAGGSKALFRLSDDHWTTVPTQLGQVDSIALDHDGVLWATSKRNEKLGIMSYKGAQSTYYDHENTPLPSSCVSSVAVDSRNVKWFGLEDVYETNCAASFDGSEWRIYNCENSGLIRAYEGKTPQVASIAVDRNDRIWFGTHNFGISCLSNVGQPDPFPSVEVSVDRSVYSNGDVMSASIVERNFGRQRWEVNLLLAIMLPDGTALYFPDWTPSACVFMPQSIRPGTETTPETFLQIQIGDWMPRGEYTWFAAFTDQAGEILGIDSVSFAIE